LAVGVALRALKISKQVRRDVISEFGTGAEGADGGEGG